MPRPLPQIKSATLDDAASLAPFHLACWHAAYSGIVPQDVLDGLERQDQRWRERLSAPGYSTLVAVDAESVVGFATVAPSEDADASPATELRSLYIRTDYYGTGLGRRLVDMALDGRAATLWVFEGNARARAFYAKTGWRATGERRIEPGTRIPELRLTRS